MEWRTDGQCGSGQAWTKSRVWKAELTLEYWDAFDQPLQTRPITAAAGKLLAIPQNNNEFSTVAGLQLLDDSGIHDG